MRGLDLHQKINSIERQQDSCSGFIDPLTSEDIKNLLEEDDFFFEYSDDGKILASAYKKPLDKSLTKENKNQIYRLGGLSRDKSEIFSEKALLKVFNKVIEDIDFKKLKVISGTTNQVIMKLFMKNGFTQLSYEELSHKFPKLLKLFLEDDKRNGEGFHKGGYIYIKNIK